eukprot:m.86342 g.86342  ORF g.86342 m.86342 type:complete len:72 (+) comp12801_c0_seq2:1939-2154(+)
MLGKNRLNSGIGIKNVWQKGQAECEDTATYAPDCTKQRLSEYQNDSNPETQTGASTVCVDTRRTYMHGCKM